MLVGKAANDESRIREPSFTSAAAATYLTQLAVAALSFFNVLVVALALGAQGRGQVAFLTTIAVLSSSLGLLGLDEANVNFAGRDPALTRALATNSVLMAALLGGAVVALLAALFQVAPGLAGDLDAGLRHLVLAAVPVLMLKVFLKFLVGAHFRFAAANAAWLLPPALALAANGALASAGLLSVELAVLAWIGSHGLATTVLVLYVARRLGGFGAPDPHLAGRALGFGVRSHAGRALMAGNYRVDQWFVGAAVGSRELGVYSVAVSLAEVLFFLPTALAIAQRPYLVRARRGVAAARAALVLRVTLLATGGFAAAVALAAPLLCIGLFGEEFRGSVAPLRLLVLGAFGIAALKVLANLLTAQRLPGRGSAAAAVAFAVTIALDVLLIPAYGASGAAAASAAAYTAGGIAAVVIFLRTTGLSARALLPRAADVTIAFRRAGAIPGGLRRRLAT